MRLRHASTRDPHELHADLANQINRLGRIRGRDSRCEYLKAVRREIEAARRIERTTQGGRL